MKAFRKVIDRILEFACCVLLVFMTFTATWQVVSRYVFKSPSTWSESMTLISFVWMALLASAYVFGRKEHMQMTFILDKFNKKNKKKIEILTEVIIFIFALSVLVFGGFNISMLEMGQKEASLNIPMGYIYMALPLSGVLTCIYNVLNLSDMLAANRADKSNKNNSKNVA